MSSRSMTGLVLPVALILLVCGCANFQDYIKDRGLDLVDIFTLKAGSGLGISTGVNIFGLLGAYTGVSKTVRAGVEGRHFVKDEHSVLGPPFYTLLVPVVSIARADYKRYDNIPLGIVSIFLSIIYPGDEKIHRNPDKITPFIDSIAEFSTADFELWLYKVGAFFGLNEPVEDPLSAGWRDYDFRVSICFFIEFEVGFSPVELLDFLLGIFTIDIMGDDVEVERKPPPPPQKREPEDELLKPLDP